MRLKLSSTRDSSLIKDDPYPEMLANMGVEYNTPFIEGLPGGKLLITMHVKMIDFNGAVGHET